MLKRLRPKMIEQIETLTRHRMKQEVNDCISNLENHVHLVFASERVSGEDFVYCPSPELYAKLDDYCDEVNFNEIRPPLLIRGLSGTGKTALLSNWLHRRQYGTSHTRGPPDEFLFWHAVGCSRQSMNTNALIRRLILALQSKFELNRPVPRNQERLSWELPRFLELAAKKGKIVVIVDGIHRLIGNDGSEDSLSWLPLELPPNVRIILSVTDTASHDSENSTGEVALPTHESSQFDQVKKSRILMELSRRKLPQIVVSPLDGNNRRSLVMDYIQTTINTETAVVTLGPYTESTLAGNRPQSGPPTSKSTIPGFLLFDCHINALLKHSCGGNPMFLRLFLRCLHFLCSKGFSLWSTFDDWITAQSVEELYHKILSSCETGFMKTRELTQTASDLALNAGGVSSLKKLFPHHPLFRNAHGEESETKSPSRNKSGSSNFQLHLHHGNEQEDGATTREGEVALSKVVRNNLGDQESVNLERQAHFTLNKAMLEAKSGVDNLSRNTMVHTRDALLRAVLEKIQNSAERVHSSENSASYHQRARALSNDTSVSSHSGGDLMDPDDETIGDSSDEEHDDDGFGMGDEAKAHNSQKEREESNGHFKANAADPLNGFFSLPSYLRGGSNTSGLGELLGNALALLYVARQGLKEEELWKILSFLENKARKDTPQAREKREQLLLKQVTVRKFGELMLKERAQFEHLFRSEDITRCGRLDVDLVLQIARRVIPDMQRSDLICLIEFVQQSLSRQKFSGVKDISSIIEGSMLSYDTFTYVLNKLFKKIKGHDMKQHMLSKEDPSPVQDIDDDFDNFNVDHARTKDHDEHGGIDEIFNAESIAAEENAGGLGAVKEELLLTVLCSVGVLYSPENKVLILPSDSELFRRTIYDKYILPRGGGSLYHWHQLIIHYFRTQPNTLRKCEELPWHLKICRKWTSLKDTLVDLKTFDLMFNNDLKDELIEYWMLLTEGPLYTTDTRASFGGTKNNKDDNVKDDQKNNERPSVLKEIDMAIEQKLSLKDVRRKIAKGLVQPFDIVEELNRSLETWVSSDRPTPMMLHRTISQISSFLLEFAKSAISYPQIRRLGIDMSIFNQFGVDLGELKLAINSSWNSLSKDTTEEDNAKQAEAADNAYFDGLQKEEVVRFPTAQMVASNFYLYLRWIWIQFPWLALNLAARTERLTANNDLLDDVVEEESRHSNDHNDYAKQLLRIWNVKKTDPTVQVFSNSLSRRLAAVKPRSSISSNLERNVEVSYKKLYNELQQPSHIAQVRLGLGVAQRDKFRRTFQQEIESTKNIPFSYHGVKAMKSGSLFPTYNAFLKESNKKKLESDLFDDNYDSDSTSQRSLVKSKKRKPLGKFDVEAALKASSNPAAAPRESTFLLTELDDEIRRMNGEEYLQSHRNEMAGTLIKDEMDLEYDAVVDRISRMKSICNKLLIIQKEKERNILELEKTIILRQESDTVLINEVQSGEALITSLHDRNVIMEKSYDEAKVLQDGYLSLIKALKLNPPYVETHVKSLEVEVSLAEKQFEELCNHRAKLYHEGERIDKIRKQQLSERIQYFKNARGEIAVKKKQVMKELKHLKETLGGRRHAGRQGNMARRDKDKRDASSPKQSDSSDDSDGSKRSNEDISLTKPVMQFINAIVRKITYNDTIIKESDTTVDDVKKRAPKINTHSNEGEKKKGKSKHKTKSVNSETEDNSPTRVVTSPQRSAASARPSFHVSQQATLSPTVGNKKRLTPEQISALRNSLKSLPEISAADIASGKIDMKTQLQTVVQTLFERTESNSLEEFVDRYQQGQSLLENLRSQQGLLDSRLAQLRVEHAELYAVWGEISFLADDQTNSAESGSADDGDQSDRYLDNQLFTKEVRMHHFQRLYDSSIHTVSDVRTAVGHIMNLLVVNSKLLSGLPRSNPPQLNCDADIVTALNWCEDRIIALNEALTMDANRTNTNANEDSKPLAQRQTELAALIHGMVADKKKRPGGHYKNSRKQQGGMSKVLINSSDPSTFVSSPRGVKIAPASKIDKIFDSKMNKVIAERDKQADMFEGQTFYSRDPKFPNNEIQRFLTDGLDKSYTKNMSRQAKLLMNNRPGRTASYGMVLEELMSSRGQTTGFLSGKTESPQKKSSLNSPATKPTSNANTVANVTMVPEQASPVTAAMTTESISASRSTEF